MNLRWFLLLIAIACFGAACGVLPPPGTAKNDVAEAPCPKSASKSEHGRAGMGVIDFRPSVRPVPPGPRIAALRAVELFPRDNEWRDVPKIGYAAGMLARGVLGAVPVEADGSARFEVPAGVEIYIQALDERGRAVHAMRSGVRLRAGETRVYVGWHDCGRGVAATDAPETLGVRKAPARMRAESQGSYPLSFARLVQPVLDRLCVDCHDGRSGRPDLRPLLFETENKEEVPRPERLCGVECLNNGWTRSYVSLREHGWFTGDDATGRGRERRSESGEIGARASRLMQMLDSGHGGGGFSDEDVHRIALWLDCNSPFFGAYHDADIQARGALVTPRLGYLPDFEN